MPDLRSKTNHGVYIYFKSLWFSIDFGTIGTQMKFHLDIATRQSAVKMERRAKNVVNSCRATQKVMFIY